MLDFDILGTGHEVHVRVLELAFDRRSRPKLDDHPPFREVRLDHVEDLVDLIQLRRLGVGYGVQDVPPCRSRNIVPKKQHLKRGQMRSTVRMLTDPVGDLRHLQVWHLVALVEADGRRGLMKLEPPILLYVLHDHLHDASESLVDLRLNLVGDLHDAGYVPRHSDDHAPLLEVLGPEDLIQPVELPLGGTLRDGSLHGPGSVRHARHGSGPRPQPGPNRDEV
mmetsp:Transcript_56558/g.157600  ORF Transcript_56558/g.157600 Transcript_56558/m.157600 type:complete len:222 (+) Transcript_56558:772-1437(+)